MDPFPPTPGQQAVIDDRSGNLLVFAGPGTGKTETLARRFASLVGDGIEPNQILVLTFSRRSAVEMRDRILLRLRQLHKRRLAVSELFIKTFHSFCGRLLDGDAVRLHRRNLLTPVKERLLWRQVLRSESAKLRSFDAAVVESSQFATDSLNMFAHLKGQGVTAEHLAKLAGEGQAKTANGADQRLTDLANLFSAMERERVRLDLHDFRDYVNEAVGALESRNRQVVSWLRSVNFVHVLVDEFQDSDLMQLRLLEVMRDVMSQPPSFCFVGDVNQSIYRFRGASPVNVTKARESFACKELTLHDNRRSAQAILNVANADASLDPRSLTTAANPALRGSALLARPRTTEEEVACIRDAVVAKVATGTNPRDIAILLRQTRPYQELIADALRDAKIPVAALPAAGFHEDALVDAVLTALRLMADPDSERLWLRLLANPIMGYRPIDVRLAFDQGRRDYVRDPRAMLRINPPAGRRPIDDLLRAWGRCVGKYETESPSQLVASIVYELDLLHPVGDLGVKGFDPAASPLRLDALLTAAEDYDDAGVNEFILRLDETIGLLSDSTQPPAGVVEGVRVMSIHAAKGLEFDFVVIPQAIDGILPASERPNRLLPARSVRALEQNKVSVFSDAQEARREEHSLWYVALTRAKHEVLVTASQVDDEGVDLQLSPFAQSIADQGKREVAQAVPHANGAAIQLPLDLPAIPIRLPIEVVTPTGIKNFLDCPRRFFYGDILRLPSRDDDLTRYGTVLHSVLRRFHELETDFTNISDVDTATARYQTMLREIVDEETGGRNDTGLGPLAKFERHDLRCRLDQYAGALALEAASAPFSVVACERVISSSFNGITLQGRVDRIDRLAHGGLVIRDYKSGRRYAQLVSAIKNLFARMDEGENVFGDAPEGLNVQIALYVPGVEQIFDERVCRLDYIYFRGRGAEDSNLLFDRTQIISDDEAGEQSLCAADIGRLERDVAARVVFLCGQGEIDSFWTARDERPCRICSFTRICPGPGTMVMN